MHAQATDKQYGKLMFAIEFTNPWSVYAGTAGTVQPEGVFVETTPPNSHAAEFKVILGST